MRWIIGQILLVIIAVAAVFWLWSVNGYEVKGYEPLIASIVAITGLVSTGVYQSIRDVKYRKGDFGIDEVFPVGIKGDYNHLLDAGTIDFLSISLRGLHDVDELIISAVITNRARVRFLILDPNSFYVKEREKQEGPHRKGKISEECGNTINQVSEVIRRISEKKPTAGSIELRTYDTMPYCSCVITDRQIRYTPYLVQLRAGSSMMLRLRPKGEAAKNLKRHFEEIWNWDSTKEINKKIWS